MVHDFTVMCGECRLRPLGLDDLEQLRVERNASRSFFLDRRAITAEGQRLWFENYLLKENDYVFSIEYDGFAGITSLYGYDPQDCSYEFGRFVVCRDKRGKGLGTEAMVATCCMGFLALNASSIRLEVLERNEKALGVYRSIGFKETGRCAKKGETVVMMRLGKADLLKGYSDVYSSVKAQL